jgi:hypothetical protein
MLYALYFLTSWIFILVVFHQYTFKYFDLLYLTFIALICGSYISFINPGKYILKLPDDKNIEFSGFHRFIIIDLAIHLFMFLFICYWYYNYYKSHININRYIHTALLIIIYMIIVTVCFLYTKVSAKSVMPVCDVYGIKFIEFLIIFIIGTILYNFL